MLLGQWGTVQPGFRGNWFMRDDRMGDVTGHLEGMSPAVRAAAVDEKARALELQLRIQARPALLRSWDVFKSPSQTHMKHC